jgi:Lrp/AsnC family transcriptional regulator, leucine-responsive regulatory protein
VYWVLFGTRHPKSVKSPVDRIDEIDAHILALLQREGRAKRNRIAEAVGLSVPAVSERMRKLEERGVLTGYYATVDAKRLGYDVTAFIRVSMAGSEHYPEFIQRVMALPEVLELHSVTGDGSHLLKVRVRSTSALEALLAKLQAIPGVRGTLTSIVLSTQKETTILPTGPMTLHANGQ